MRTIPEILNDCDERERAARKAIEDNDGMFGVIEAVAACDAGTITAKSSGARRIVALIKAARTDTPALVADTRDLVRRVEVAEASDAESLAMYRRARDRADKWKALAEQLAGALRTTGTAGGERYAALAAFAAATRPQTTAAPAPDHAAALAREMRDINPASPALAAYDADGLARIARLANGKGE